MSERLNIELIDKLIAHLAESSNNSTKLLDNKSIDETAFVKQLVWNQRAIMLSLEGILNYIKNCKEDLGC